MLKPQQGDLLKISGFSDPVIVVSNSPFNKSGKIMACPVQKNTRPNPLHIEITAGQITVCVLCEQVKFIDLSSRNASKIASAGCYDVMNISDAVMGMFDYQDI